LQCGQQNLNALLLPRVIQACRHQYKSKAIMMPA